MDNTPTDNILSPNLKIPDTFLITCTVTYLINTHNSNLFKWKIIQEEEPAYPARLNKNECRISGFLDLFLAQVAVFFLFI